MTSKISQERQDELKKTLSAPDFPADDREFDHDAIMAIGRREALKSKICIPFCLLVLPLAISIGVNYYDGKFDTPYWGFLKEFRSSSTPSFAANSAPYSGRIVTKAELAKHAAPLSPDSLWLGIAGEVFDVTSGKDHYTEGKGYSFFTGTDGTRAFVTGEFNADGLVPSVAGLEPSEVQAIEEWRAFYEKDYTFVGRLVGHYFDASGQPTASWHAYRAELATADVHRQQLEELKKEFPPCNARSGSNVRSEVWCTRRSGGVDRDFVGVPRLFKIAGQKNLRCACVRDSLLSDRRLSPYEGCDAAADRCFTDVKEPKAAAAQAPGPKV